MGYLNNSTIVVDAILTRKGRELLARGQNEFNITHFALADDEIDYTLWNSDHPLGTAFYGAVIEAMPITEAVPDETQVMKYKLVTLPKRTVRIPVVSVPNSSITLSAGQQELIKPSTINYAEGNSTYGYTAVLADSDVATLEVVEPSAATTSMGAPAISDLESGQAVTLTGKVFRVKAKGAIESAKRTTLTIYGNETGGQTVVNILVTKQTLNTTPGTPLTGQPPISLP
jgi:hypothetical protein